MDEQQFSSTPAAPVSSTDDGGAVPERPWFVLRVKSRAEKTVRENLVRMGFDAIAATRFEYHTWRRGEQRKVERVLIPSVVFVRMNKSDQLAILHCPGVSSFMYDPLKRKGSINSWETLARISNRDMQVFRQMLAQEDVEVNFTASQFNIGEEVRIKGFDEAHNQAQIVRIFGDGKTYIGVRVGFLGCAYMELPLERIAKF